MTKEDLISALTEFDAEDLQTALQAARAAKRSRASGHYFLHYFFDEQRFHGDTGQSGVRMPISNVIMNPAHMVHGGVTAFLCDNAMGMASYIEKSRPGVTLEMSVRYHKPARGSMLSAVGHVVAAGSQINSMRCEVQDDSGDLVASATGSFYHRRG